MTLALFLLILAFISFTMAAINPVANRLNIDLKAVGLALWSLSIITGVFS